MINTYKTRLKNKLQLTEKIYLFHFSLIEPRLVEFFPGQYMILLLPNEQKRLYSIASSPQIKDSFELIVEIVDGGIGSNYLKNLNINDEIIFQGPAGVFTLKENNNSKFFLTTGTGIAPVRSMIKKLQATNSKSQRLLFWGLKNFKDVYLLDELKNYPNLNFKICLSREENLEMIKPEDRKYFSLGHVDNICLNQISNLKFQILNSDFYLCGSPIIVESLRASLLQQKISAENIFFEKF